MSATKCALADLESVPVSVILERIRLHELGALGAVSYEHPNIGILTRIDSDHLVISVESNGRPFFFEGFGLFSLPR